jgi:hypothetical protein
VAGVGNSSRKCPRWSGVKDRAAWAAHSGGEHEPVGATHRVHDRVTGPEADHSHDGLDQVQLGEGLPVREPVSNTKLEDLVALCVWRW